MQSKDVTKAFHILRGIFGGAHTHRHFCIVFDWFYPQYFGIIQKSLIAFIENPKIVNLIFQFLSELLDNTGNRLRFDTWNINGLIIYKESSNFMAQFLNFSKCLTQNIREDVYLERYKFLKILMNMLSKCITGGYINFAVCDFYNDNSFSELCTLVL